MRSELAFDQAGIEVEEGQEPQLAASCRLEDPSERGFGDRSATQARHHRGDRNRQATERHGHVGRQHPAEAHTDGLLDDDDLLRVLECVPNGIDRERPERGDAHRTDPVPGGALRVHDVLDRPEHRAHGHDHHVGVGTPVRVYQAARVAPERLGEFRAQRPDAVQRRELAGVRQVAHLLERLGAHHGADGVGLCRVEHLAGLVGGQERCPPAPGWEGSPARWHG